MNKERTMISKQKFIHQSLELNLFFLRIMKEHSIFLEAGFLAKDKNLISRADALKNEFTRLLSQAVSLADGVITPSLLEANEIVTQYTFDAERATQFVSGIYIDSNITKRERSLSSGGGTKSIAKLAERIGALNDRALVAVNEIINFKTHLINEVAVCKLFTANYPLLIEHIRREAILFRDYLTKLQNGIELEMKSDMLEQETFWNRIMSEHAFFIRGLLDPTEEELFDIANSFGKEFEALRKESSAANITALDLSALTSGTLQETIKLRDFKAQGTEGLLGCKIKSIILPLLGDHVLREANHYINLLKAFSAK